MLTALAPHPAGPQTSPGLPRAGRGTIRAGQSGGEEVRVTGRRWRHGLRTVLITGFALLATGGLYTAFTPAPQAAAQPDDAVLVAQGRELFTASCISCHGANLQGVPQRGPSIVGAGDAAVYFQVSSGRMPLAREDPQAYRKPPPPQFDPDTVQGQHNLQALGAYVQAA